MGAELAAVGRAAAETRIPAARTTADLRTTAKAGHTGGPAAAHQMLPQFHSQPRNIFVKN